MIVIDSLESHVFQFLALFIRLSSMIVLMPILGDRFIPAQVKILLSFAISVALYPPLLNGMKLGVPVYDQMLPYVIICLSECLMGLIIGFISRIFFDAIQIGGTALGTLMGFATASQFDPHQESQTQLIAQFQLTLASLVFLVLDGHHRILLAAAHSYELVPVGNLLLRPEFKTLITLFSSQIIEIGFLIAAPMAISMFMVNIIYGLIAKTMPQLNILVLSFSISALLGFFVLMFSLPGFFEVTQELFSRIDFILIDFIGALKA